MLEKYWIKCPICNGKTRVQVFYNVVIPFSKPFESPENGTALSIK